MAHLATLTILFVLALGLADASISSVKLQSGDSFLIREGEHAKALVRSLTAGSQRMEFSGRNRGKWVDQNGKTVDSSRFHLYRNGSVLIRSARPSDSGTYQKDPNPMIRIGDMGYAPPVLIIQVV
uniref:Ricin B-type lectin domain-containing protein n=1 Tax=Caenorhabditis tropicalis TaxID=1561998 RepID=A0A1I7UKP1_9PELO